MSSFLFWYIFRDLLKLLVITTAVLVTVISFGAAIQPLAEGVLGPFRLLVFILLAMPPMLQFALPFSAAFSATIVYHRMSQDNEITVCAASGVPYTQLLLPAATLGVILTILLSFLANSVSPAFWEAMELTARLDAPEFFVRSTARGEPIKAGNSFISARDVRQVPPPEGSKAYATLEVDGLLIADIRKGDMVWAISAPRGVFNLTRMEGQTVITSVLEDATWFDNKSGMLLRLEEPEIGTYAIPDSFNKKPKFMNLADLKALSLSPQTYWRVRERIVELRIWLANHKLYQEVDSQLQNGQRVILSSPFASRSDDSSKQSQRYELIGGKLTGHNPRSWGVAPASGDTYCRLIRYEDGRPVREIIASEVHIAPRINSIFDEPTLEITMVGVEVSILTADPPIRNRQERLVIPGMRLTTPIIKPIHDLEIQPLVEQARAATDVKTVEPLIERIERELGHLQGVILARLHERTALSVSCLAMMLLGATLAIYLKEQLPLTVYFWSFVPAIGGLVLIGAGNDLIASLDVSDVWGLIVMWSGNLIMCLFAFVVLKRLSKN